MLWCFGTAAATADPLTPTVDTLAPADGTKPSAADRLERRRAFKAKQPVLPLPGTPDTERPLSRLAEMGLKFGDPLMLRFFKEEFELEVWYAKDGRYIHFATYPICHYSGGPGPKLREGDRQTPEGFYSITTEQLHDGGRWSRSLDIGYPNAYDRENSRTGSYILIHGGCDSIGCFAMTNPVNDEIYELVSAALRRGVDHIPVHVFPFRMTDAAMAARGETPWSEFWSDLKQGYDAFERTRLPPQITVCNSRYRADEAAAGSGVESGPIKVCPGSLLAAAVAEGVATDADGQLARAAAGDSHESRPQRSSGKRKRSASGPRKCTQGRASCRKWMALREKAGKSTGKRKQSAARSKKRQKAR